VRVHYAEGLFVAGDVRRADVLLLHGIPFDGEAMRPLSALLEAQGVATARVDLPGLGRSGDRPSTGLDIAWLARLLEGRTKPIVLLGHSLGATLAVRFAAAFPDAVRALVLVAPTFLNAPPSAALQVRPAVAHVLCGLDAVRFQERFLADANSEAVRPAIESALLSLKRKGGASRYAASLAEVSTQNARKDTLLAYRALRTRGMPITIVHADREPLIEDAMGAMVSSIEGAGHNPHLTHAEAVHRALIGHIPAMRPAALGLRAPL
jgi:pimeloyl-ACP methyl ester carboxylesterase